MEFEFDSPPNSPDPSLDKSTATKSRSSLHTSFSSPSSVVSSRGKKEISVQVRGAGTSTSELQDAGSFQMIQDECQYHCSAILSSRTPTQMMDAMVDLITLLSNRKNRKTLWQSLSSKTSDDPLKATAVSPLVSILDVIATQFSPSTLQSPRSTSSVLSDVASVSSTIIPKGGPRTKSARRKLKQQQQGQPTPTSTSGSVVANHDVSSSPEARQLLAILVTLLSWDCTISKPHSVAAMDAKPQTQLAQQVRLTILQHPKALQAILRSSCNSVNGLTGEPTSTAPSCLLSPPPSSVASLPQTDSVASSTHSVSSISHDDSQSTTNEDPTKVGRRNRRRRRLEQIQQQQQSQGPLTPVQESSTPLEDSLDFGSMPPPAKRQQSQPPPSALSARTSLSFTSDEAPGRTMVDPSSASQSVQTSSQSARRFKKLQAVRSRLWPKQKVQCTCSSCSPAAAPSDASSTSVSNLWISLALWQAVHRIVSGKEGDEPSCLEPAEEDDDDDDDDEDPVEDEPNNPILVTNQLLDKAGVIPLFSQCMSEILEHLQESNEESSRKPKSMALCQQWKLEGLDHLASLMDGACLLHPTNRRSFVEYDPFSFEIQRKEQGLMYQILSFLWGVLQQKSVYSLDSHPLLLALRTLTSLSHDNPVAAEQVLELYQFEKGKRASMRGLEVLAKLLFQLVSKPLESSDDFETTTNSFTDTTDDPTHRYDSTNFCLNTITNIIESSDARKVLSECTIQTPSGRESWLVWLCHWQTKQTEGFRDAIMSIGNSNADARHSKRELQKSEEEKLVIAGNGCIVLACLMMDHKSEEEPELTDRIREIILEELAVTGTTKSAAFDLMINTLKAFCNFYHFSLGELSVAVIAPVKKLMDRLAELQQELG
eukprot:Nitzschia sp. Nitz4//scaffold6_size259037//185262//187904//NITZ4_001099-RA/size259037-processed-gene-0.86-mRNA-1//-1//CDS//3329556968//5513//frame0